MTPNGNDYGKDLLRQHYQQHLIANEWCGSAWPVGKSLESDVLTGEGKRGHRNACEAWDGRDRDRTKAFRVTRIYPLPHWTKSLRDSLELTELARLRGCASMPRWIGVERGAQPHVTIDGWQMALAGKSVP